MSITPTLESALADLPAKPRVHELSKRIGISNKELLTALAERGLTIKSASSSVPADVAREVIEAFLTQGDADGQTADAAQFDRMFDLFDGSDPAAVQAARQRWVAAKAAGHTIAYWLQGERGWEKKA